MSKQKTENKSYISLSEVLIPDRAKVPLDFKKKKWEV